MEQEHYAIGAFGAAADTLAANGLRHARQGRWREARDAFRAALNADPRHFDALQNLGVVELQTGEPDQALKHLEAAAVLRPDAPEVHNNLALANATLGHTSGAIDHYRKTLALRPDQRGALERLVQLLFADLRPLDALAVVEDVARRRPDLGFAHAMHAAVLRTFGRVDEACAAAERAISAEPGNAQHYYLLSQLKTFRQGDPHLVTMQDLLQHASAPDGRARTALLFALAKAYRDVGEEERSFDLLDEANRTARHQHRYDEARELGLLADVKAAFSPAFFRRHGGAGHPSQAPVFILGMPRSGTTLVEQILASHPHVAGAGENMVAVEAVQHVLPRFPQGVDRLSMHDLATIGADYVAGIGKLLARADRVIDKSLTGVIFAGLLHAALPNARFIHVVRDPVDACLSCYSLNFGEGLNFTYDLSELGRYYRAHEDLAAYWETVFAPASIITVRYEDVVREPEREIRRMLDHVGLPWSAACLSPEKSERAVFTASAGQVREPIGPRRAAYRSVLPNRLNLLIKGLGDFARRRA